MARSGPTGSPALAADPRAWARALGISVDAVAQYAACEVVDMHVESFI